MRKLSPASLDWALEHLRRHSDTDKFPRLFEVDVMVCQWASLRPELANLDLTQHRWKGERKMLVPKDAVSFRNAAQLDPIDAVLFAALVYEVGASIERTRSAAAAGRIFSYRFVPQPDGTLFGPDEWESFWRSSIEWARSYSTVVVVDITDFYNQVSHHSIETQLQRCGLQQMDVKIMMNLLKSETVSVSRGIPVGPHPAHLLAEAALIPIDELLVQRGLEFCRYVDDIHIFCPTDDEAQVALFAVARALDQYHKLTINRSKTKVMSAEQFTKYAEGMAEDQPINSTEESILRVIQKYSTGPYESIPVSVLAPEDLAQLSQAAIEDILGAYLSQPTVDFIRLRFLLRRLTQVGVPGGVDYLVRRLSDVLPAFAEVAGYLASATAQYKGTWANLGEDLLKVLDSPIAKESEYVQLVLMGLFARIAELNHIDKLIQRYGSNNASVQREIVLAAAVAGADAWLRTLKEDFSRWDPWLRRAFAYAIRIFPTDEREFWRKAVMHLCDAPLERALLADSMR